MNPFISIDNFYFIFLTNVINILDSFFSLFIEVAFLCAQELMLGVQKIALTMNNVKNEARPIAFAMPT